MRGGTHDWGSTVIQMFFVFIGPEIFMAAQFIASFATGYHLSETTGIIMGLIACIMSVTNTLTLG